MSNNTKALKSKIISSRPQEGSLVHRVEPETLGQRLDFKRTVKKKKKNGSCSDKLKASDPGPGCIKPS